MVFSSCRDAHGARAARPGDAVDVPVRLELQSRVAWAKVRALSMNDVRLRLSTVLALLGITAAGAFAAGRSTSSSSSSVASAPAAPPAVAENDFAPAAGEGTELPPGHPPVGSGAGMGDLGSAAADAPETPLTWKVPKRWIKVPSPSSMRLATYRVPPDAEMSVTQAGGTVDANAERWIGQFDEAARKGARRTTRKVHGLDVTIVEVSGQYSGGMSADAGGAGFALVGVIVGTPQGAMPHFFKLTGPAKSVAAARGEVDELVGSLEIAQDPAPKPSD
jgi:hypothetical protein